MRSPIALITSSTSTQLNATTQKCIRNANAAARRQRIAEERRRHVASGRTEPHRKPRSLPAL